MSAHSHRSIQGTVPDIAAVDSKKSAMRGNLRPPDSVSGTPPATQAVPEPRRNTVVPPLVNDAHSMPPTKKDAATLSPARAQTRSVGREGYSGSTLKNYAAERPSSQYPAVPEKLFVSFADAAEGKLHSSETQSPTLPVREHSVIVTEGKRYCPVVNELPGNQSFYPFSPFKPITTAPWKGAAVDESHVPEVSHGYDGNQNLSLAAPQVRSQGFAGITERGIFEAPRGGLKRVLCGHIEEEQPRDGNDPINSFTFFVGANDADERPSSIPDKCTVSSPLAVCPASSSAANAPYGAPPLQRISSSLGGGDFAGVGPDRVRGDLVTGETAKLVHALWRSSARQLSDSRPPSRNGDYRSGNLSPLAPPSAGLCTGGHPGMSPNASLAFDEEKAADHFRSLPMHHALSCSSRENLEDDTVSLIAVWESLKSEALMRNILFGFRVTAFAVLPTFLLVEHPRTRDWFVSGSLLPILAGLFVRPSLGASIAMAVIAFQTVAVFMTWGIIMNAVGARNNLSGWWCGAIFGCAFFSLFGDLPAKRLMMMFVIIIMQTEHSPGGETLTFVGKYAANVVIAAFFTVLAASLPYPTLSYKQADESLLNLHKLHSAGVGNAMKSFWAPVSMDAKMALKQIPFVKINALTTNVRTAINFATYEPFELNLNNILRNERLVFLQRIKMHLYAMSAASANRLENVHWLHRSQIQQDIREFEKRVQTPAMNLADEVMRLLVQIGRYLDPNELCAKVSFADMAEKTQILSDLIERQQLEMLLMRNLSEEETNACLGLLGFHYSLIDIAVELQRFENRMKTFDPSHYPSVWRRAFNFFFYDRWCDFWSELPKRLAMSTPYNIRLLKDTIRYTGGFAVACAFTLNYDRENVYYFGMTILIRLAQQTASETLAIGIHRICGLCIGVSLSYFTASQVHNLAGITALTMAWVFVSMCFSLHPVYGCGAQYVAVTSVAGLRLATSPSLLLARLIDNVFAFISYYLICTFVFPVDPIRVLWNMRTKCFIRINDLAQIIVSLGCAPITQEGRETDFLVAKARALVKEQQALLKQYGDWVPKCATEPTIRGGDYPTAACASLRLCLGEVMSLEEALVSSMERLHRLREQPPGIILRDMMELTRPFLLDAGKLIRHFCQCMIDATEQWRTWSMEESLHTIWKTVLACRSLHHVTGNIQRNFYAAALQVDHADRQALNMYVNASIVEEALSKGLDSAALLDTKDEDLVKRLLATSIQISKDKVISRDDIQAFNALVIVFELLFKSLSELLPPIIQIYEYEKSRHV
ncbi:hypothetical protein JKF63_02524 [Porcisia hertigi]|uniref:Uncharacterized protein n=1 Tax=Porcisia hertigi TaxID=2761500 RepID=A0A836LDM5_9TRYP|nr:hypothetical protein JKF63_02524 [Porcisia hertigi]